MVWKVNMRKLFSFLSGTSLHCLDFYLETKEGLDLKRLPEKKGVTQVWWNWPVISPRTWKMGVKGSEGQEQSQLPEESSRDLDYERPCLKNKKNISKKIRFLKQKLWTIPAVPVLRRLREEDQRFCVNLCCIARPRLNERKVYFTCLCSHVWRPENRLCYLSLGYFVHFAF